MAKTSSLKKEKFLNKIQEIYPDIYSDLEKYFYVQKPVSFRINKLKSRNSSDEQLIDTLKKQDFEITAGPINNSYICNSRDIKLSETKEFNNGLIYIQSLSSMLPVLYMDLKPGQNILDMCAAPGSKTSQIAAELNDECFITAIENNKNRFYALKKNLENLGVHSANVLYDNSITLPVKYPNFINNFDRILLDVPCSNEGFVDFANPKFLERWNSKTASRLSKLQKTLLFSGVSLLKPGSLLLYSTCTYSVEENEKVIDWALKKFKNLRCQNLRIQLNNVTDGFTEWKEEIYNEELVKTKRILPTSVFTGFYITLLKKLY